MLDSKVPTINKNWNSPSDLESHFIDALSIFYESLRKISSKTISRKFHSGTVKRRSSTTLKDCKINQKKNTIHHKATVKSVKNFKIGKRRDKAPLLCDNRTRGEFQNPTAVAFFPDYKLHLVYTTSSFLEKENDVHQSIANYANGNNDVGKSMWDKRWKVGKLS